MPRWVALACLSLAAGPAAASAQDDGAIVLVVDPGEARINQARLIRALERATGRRLIRMTDEAAPLARGRLSIAFSRPNRWVLRYEADGQVAWISDRIERPSEIRSRLAQLANRVVTVIDGAAPAASAAPAPRRSTSWDDVILALQDEIIDPFDEDHPRHSRAVTVLWSEVIDPFADPSIPSREVWSEVLDPWSSDTARR